jgi:hypothetical protein
LTQNLEKKLKNNFKKLNEIGIEPDDEYQKELEDI